MIIKKDINHLSDKISDLDWIFETFGEIFDNGGKLGGGSLRRAIFENSGLIKEVSANSVSRSELGIKNIPGFRKAMEKRAIERYAIRHQQYMVDIDFFFENTEDYNKCVNLLAGTSIFESSSGYANSFVYVEPDGSDFIFRKVQIVHRDISKYNKISKIINDFDFINCMIAIDKENVFYHRDFFEKNEKRILSCNENTKTRWNFFQRIEKYLKFNDSIENHIIPTIQMIKDTYGNNSAFMGLMSGDKFMTKDELLCLYKVGNKELDKFIRFSLDYDSVPDSYVKYNEKIVDEINKISSRIYAANQSLFLKGRQIGATTTLNAAKHMWKTTFKGGCNV